MSWKRICMEKRFKLSASSMICGSLIRIWIEKAERGEYDNDAVQAELLPEYESRIAALELLFGRQAL